ncbi:Vms1/Ankzf1 family peptidyl-tRNA hydrolase [Halobacterium rubrum]|uniref:Vms1/Ankzf1 family peptidyl-tRNA hydrolase n=1 Tax=Halobacterium TaxID=2239 RepID=UPI001F48AC8C|nr:MULTISPECIES: Vms1/Ankzf1 family peptidyl-tRNA hydrolase [Halobacterium]MDH5019389.1 Vms1/Ankzf1 family peptidyl-tRNA hydrolase [Halobacterium rubrum]
MLDDILGRTELKERIEDLEGEKESLANQLAAEEERRSEAARKRQEAERRVNELEAKIEELEDRLDRAEADDAGPDFRGRADLTGRRRERVLTLLASLEAGEEGVLTAYVPDDPPDAVRDALGERAPLVERAAPCVVVRDQEGVVSLALRPPNPPAAAFCEWGETARVDREWVAPTGRYALAVVRADLFAVGTYQDGQQESFEGFESNVKSDHSKGGFSQARFERLRDEQIREHVEKCREALADVEADRTFVVGQETLLGEFDADATAAVDATGDPEDALADAHEDFWTLPLSLL